MKLLILPALLISSSLFAQETRIDHAVAIPGAHPKAVIRPLLRENSELYDNSGIADFMNGLTVSCPEGMEVVDTKHLLRDNMSYKDSFNAMASLECHYPNNSK